ncbi:ATP-dependent helicase [Candidatus Woesebacteria bacterium]|nr:ATP-dependent helicase [Candidatus Woesebacteria bacterium]
MVAKKIKELTLSENKKDSNYKYSDFAILVRANNHAEPFIMALSRKGIPHQFLGPGRLFRQNEVIDMISYLKVIYNFEDSVALYRVLSMDYFDIPARDLAALGNMARKKNLSLFEICEKIDEVVTQPRTKEKIKKLVEIINKHLKLAMRESAGQILYYFLTDTGILQSLIDPKNIYAERKAKNISKLFDKIKSYEVDHEDSTVGAVVDWIDLSSELGESPLAADTDWTEVDAVNILTVHSAKGLEFPVVFLVNLVAQRFPTSERREQIPIPEELIKEVLPKGDFHLEEERRLFYVGMTRAKDLLFLTAANYYGEGKREKKLSPFIFEALGDSAVGSEETITKTKQLSFLDFITNEQQAEEVTKSHPLHIDFLSYSQIETFNVCPLHYKLRYILKIPTPMTAPLSFGISMHESLKDFYVGIKDGKRASQKMLFDCLEKDWIKDGYLSKTHELKFLEMAEEYLTFYLKHEFIKEKQPILLEHNFVVPIRDNNRYHTKISTIRDKESLDRAISKIFDICEKIEKSDFRCSGSMLCETCEYSLMCRSDTGNE